MPDEELFAQAVAGKLHEPAVAAVQVKRMLADSKVEQLVHNFAGQWLNRAHGGTRSLASNSGSSSNFGQRRSTRAIGSRLMRSMKAWQAAINSGTL